MLSYFSEIEAIPKSVKLPRTALFLISTLKDKSHAMACGYSVLHCRYSPDESAIRYHIVLIIKNNILMTAAVTWTWQW